MKNLIIGLAFIALVFTPALGYEVSLLVAGGLFALALAVPTSVEGAFNMAIPVQDAQSIYTKGLVASYAEKPVVKKWLSSFFKPNFTMTKEVSIEVQRGSERVAVDVFRFSDGNRNTFDKSTEKVMVPPLYDEYLTVNEHRLYEEAINGIASGNLTFFQRMTAEQAEQLVALRNKIERAIELQCAQIFETGVVTLASGDDIDFKRKAASIVAYNAANAFNIDTVDPRKVMSTGCKFIREKGKYQSGTFNAILGESAMTALLANPFTKPTEFNINDVMAPQNMPVGATSHGWVSAGSYIVYLWTYPEFYENASGVSTSYINDKKMILLPTTVQYDLAFAAVPQLIQKDGSIPQKAEYLIRETMDEDKGQHKIKIMAAPIAIPTKIDTLYTIQVIS
jgi:uncharacterized protein YrrD